MQRPAQIRIDWTQRALASLDRLAQRRGRSAALPAHLLTGLEGEDAAYFHLRRRGYVFVARRWSAGNLPGDVDLIAWQGERLCFIEVKTRTARDLSPAEIAVDREKRALLRRLARHYLRQLPQSVTSPMRPVPVRFDVISVYLTPGKPAEIEHFEDAFGWAERREDVG
jgi:putative endonuclease